MTTAARKHPKGSKPFHLPAIALASNGGAPKVPDWVMIFPAGQTQTNDGRLYRNNDPEGAIARTEEIGLFIPADIAHGMEEGSPEPSMGWVEEYEVRDGAVWGKVDWTDLGREKILSKHYRYISPAFHHDEDLNLLSFSSIALVNSPAFTMPALANSQKSAKATALQNPSTLETNMDEETLAKFRKLFNLAEDADETAAQAAIDKALAALDEPEADPADKDAPASDDDPAADDVIIEDKGPASLEVLPENPDPDNFVYKADYDAVVDRLTAQALDAADAPSETEVTAAVETAMASGRISPATKSHHVAMCSTRAGLDNFKAMVKVSPKIVTKTASKKAVASKERSGHGLTDNQVSMCSRMGLDPKAYASTLAKSKT